MSRPAVLIGYSACPLTREAFERAGCDAWTCDTLPARDGNTERHLQCDIWEALFGRAWDGALLHPMCTYLTISAAWAYKDPDFEKYPKGGYHQRVKAGTLVGEARRRARTEAIDNFRALLALPFPLGVENPAPSFINRAIRPPTQIIHPYQFGNDASKSTGLWLQGLPPLRSSPSLHVAPRAVCSSCGHCGVGLAAAEMFTRGCPACGVEAGRILPRWANQTDSGQNRLSPDEDRWLERSKTYPGIAAAIGEQWGRFLVAKVNP